jgi:hypothetical protein
MSAPRAGPRQPRSRPHRGFRTFIPAFNSVRCTHMPAERTLSCYTHLPWPPCCRVCGPAARTKATPRSGHHTRYLRTRRPRLTHAGNERTHKCCAALLSRPFEGKGPKHPFRPTLPPPRRIHSRRCARCRRPRITRGRRSTTIREPCEPKYDEYTMNATLQPRQGRRHRPSFQGDLPRRLQAPRRSRRLLMARARLGAPRHTWPVPTCA